MPTTAIRKERWKTLSAGMPIPDYREEECRVEIKWSELLLRANTSTEFFAEAKTQFKKNTPKLSYALLAKKWGMASKSLVAEILNGRRRPSYRAFAHITRSLEFTPNQRELLRLLITRDDPKFSSQPVKDIDFAITQARNKLRNRKSSELTRALQNEKYLETWPKVYSVVGKESSLESIVHLANRPMNEVQTILDALVRVGLIERTESRYHSFEHHVTLDPALHRKMIEAFIHTELTRLIPQLHSIYEDPEQMLFGGAFMVKKKNLPAMKKKLKTYLSKFIDDHYDSDGDTVISLIQALKK